MFQKRDMSIVDWILFFILMAIPLLNIVVFIMLLVSPKTCPSLKSYLIVFLILIVIIGLSWATILASIMNTID